VALIAWHKLTRTKSEGGIGFKQLTAHADALLSRWVTAALDAPCQAVTTIYKASSSKLLQGKNSTASAKVANFFSTAPPTLASSLDQAHLTFSSQADRRQQQLLI
jgi:hypothetical protein